MTLVLDGIPGTTVVLAVMYCGAALYTGGKLRMLHSISPELNLQKLLVMSVFLSCLMRMVSFVTITGLNFQSINVDMQDDRHTSDQEVFFEKAVIVLFDLPDFSIVSAYVLLGLVWMEAFLQSRRHWLSAVVYRRHMIVGYLACNMCLYLWQLTLYAMLFVPSVDQRLLSSAIYLTLTSISLLLPLAFMALYLYLNIKFAGFPYSSKQALVRLRKLGGVVILWSLARCVWGIVALTTVMQEWLTTVRRSSEVYSVMLISVFVLTELIPFLTSLTHELLTMLASDVSNTPEAHGATEGDTISVNTPPIPVNTRTRTNQNASPNPPRSPRSQSSHSSPNKVNPDPTEQSPLQANLHVPVQIRGRGYSFTNSYTEVISDEEMDTDGWHEADAKSSTGSFSSRYQSPTQNPNLPIARRNPLHGPTPTATPHSTPNVQNYSSNPNPPARAQIRYPLNPNPNSASSTPPRLPAPSDSNLSTNAPTTQSPPEEKTQEYGMGSALFDLLGVRGLSPSKPR